MPGTLRTRADSRGLLPNKHRKRNLLDRSNPYAEILDLADDAIISVTRDHRIVLFNQGAERMFGYSSEEAISQPLEILLPASAIEVHRSYIEMFAESGVIARRMGDRNPITGRRKDGSEFPAEASISKATIGDEITFTVIMRDVTQRTISDERLKASLREKEALLQEVHHRVKNNLQVVSSLLGLQSRSIEDAATRKMFEESQDRIRSMALLHECLYQSPDLAHIDFADYLRKLSEQLFRSYDAGGRIRFKSTIQKWQFSMDVAVPCGLIVTELISNCLKYAFPDGRHGRVLVDLQVAESGDAELTVTDDGVGLPAEIDWKSSRTLGLRLVRILAHQIQAKVALNRENGTSFTIVFPIHPVSTA